MGFCCVIGRFCGVLVQINFGVFICLQLYGVSFME